MNFPDHNADFEWWLDDDRLWMRHRCVTDGRQLVQRLPPPWHMEGDAPSPSLDCKLCGAHRFVTAADRVAALWNWMIPVDELCGSCDGKDAPDPDCEWCSGTGRDAVPVTPKEQP